MPGTTSSSRDFPSVQSVCDLSVCPGTRIPDIIDLMLHASRPCLRIPGVYPWTYHSAPIAILNVKLARSTL